MAEPTSANATIQSKLKTFGDKRSAKAIVFDRSPIWQYWEPSENISPSNLADAPVMLSRGPTEYWIFGRYDSVEDQEKANKCKKGNANQRQAEKKKATPSPKFTPQSAALNSFELPLQTTPLPNQYDTSGGLKKSKGGYHAWQSRDKVNWVHHGPITEDFSRWVTTAQYVDGKTYIYYHNLNDQDPHLYIDENLKDGVPGKDMGMAFKLLR